MSGMMSPVTFLVLAGWWGPGTPRDPAGSSPRGRRTSCSSPRCAGFGTGAACQPRHPAVSGPSAVRLVGSRGRSVSLPAAAGTGLERCRGVCSGLSSASRAGAVPVGSAPGPALGAKRVSGPAGKWGWEILRSLSVALPVFYRSRLEGHGVPDETVFVHLKPVIVHCFGGFP